MPERKIGRKIKVTTFEVLAAMHKMGKNKATSVDGVSDIIFRK